MKKKPQDTAKTRRGRQARPSEARTDPDNSGGRTKAPRRPRAESGGGGDRIAWRPWRAGTTRSHPDLGSETAQRR